MLNTLAGTLLCWCWYGSFVQCYQPLKNQKMGKGKITPLDLIVKRYGVVTTSDRINGSMILQVQLGDLSKLMEDYAAAKLAERQAEMDAMRGEINKLLGKPNPSAPAEAIAADLPTPQAVEAPNPLPAKEVAEIPNPVPVRAPRKR